MDRRFTVTVGTGDTDRSWCDVRQLSWPEIYALLTDHQEGNKRGPCIVPARFRGQRRIQAEADEIGIAMLDADCGHDLDEIALAIRAKGWAAVIHSTHSHLTTRTKASRARWEAFFGDCPIAAEEYFLREKGYLAPIAQGARVVETGKREIVFEHAPCPKFRVALPLSRPWRAAEYPHQKIANAAWKERIEALAAALGLHHDQSCTDTSRLFYLPRHAAGAPFATLIIDGEACDIWSLPAVAASTAATVPPPQPHLSIGSTRCADATVIPGAERVDLTRWAASCGHRFRIVDALKAWAPHIFTGHVADGVKHHIRCAADDQHTDPGADNATFIIDVGHSENGGFVYHCRHAHCDGRDRLEFLRRMIERGWLAVADLTDPSFLRAEEEKGPKEAASFEDLIAAAERLTDQSRPDAINDVLARIYEAKLDPVSLRVALTAIKHCTGLPLGDLRRGLDAIRAQHDGPLEDLGLKVARITLAEFFADGDHLVRGVDKCFWAYRQLLDPARRRTGAQSPDRCRRTPRSARGRELSHRRRRRLQADDRNARSAR